MGEVYRAYCICSRPCVHTLKIVIFNVTNTNGRPDKGPDQSCIHTTPYVHIMYMVCRKVLDLHCNNNTTHASCVVKVLWMLSSIESWPVNRR